MSEAEARSAPVPRRVLHWSPESKRSQRSGWLQDTTRGYAPAYSRILQVLPTPMSLDTANPSIGAAVLSAYVPERNIENGLPPQPFLVGAAPGQPVDRHALLPGVY